MEGVAFQELAWTISVNQHGGKLSTEHRLSVGDSLMLSHPVLGNAAQARVVRLEEKGRAFEIAVELLDHSDVWGMGPLREDGNGGQARVAANPGNDSSAAADGPSRAERIPDAAPAAASADLPNLAANFPTFRRELDALSGTVQEIQVRSLNVLRDFSQNVHSHLCRQLETAAENVLSETRQRVREEIAAAVETAFKDALEQFRTETREISAACRSDLELERKSAVEAWRSQLEEAAAGLKTQATEDLANRFEELSAKVCADIKNRATAGFEILNEHLETSARNLTREAETNITTRKAEALAAVEQQLGAAMQAFQSSSTETQRALDERAQAATENAKNQIEELSRTALAQCETASEVFVKNLQARLFEAAGALHRLNSLTPENPPK
jgi:hypothetical protein